MCPHLKHHDSDGWVRYLCREGREISYESHMVVTRAIVRDPLHKYVLVLLIAEDMFDVLW